VSASASKHRAGVRATVPAVQVRRECSFGAAGVPWDLMDGLSNSDSASSRPDPRSRSPMCAQKMLKRGFAPPALSNLSKPNLSCVLGGPNAPAVMGCWRGHGDCRCRRCQWHGQKPRRSRPPGGITWGLEKHVILPGLVRSRGPRRSSSQANPGQAVAARSKRGKRGVSFAVPGCGYSRATLRGTSHQLN